VRLPEVAVRSRALEVAEIAVRGRELWRLPRSLVVVGEVESAKIAGRGKLSI
jgi:hypothetical protein